MKLCHVLILRRPALRDRKSAGAPVVGARRLVTTVDQRSMAQYVAPSIAPSVATSTAATSNMVPHAVVNACGADGEGNPGGSGDFGDGGGGSPRAVVLAAVSSVVVSVADGAAASEFCVCGRRCGFSAAEILQASFSSSSHFIDLPLPVHFFLIIYFTYLFNLISSL